MLISGERERERERKRKRERKREREKEKEREKEREREKRVRVHPFYLRMKSFSLRNSQTFNFFLAHPKISAVILGNSFMLCMNKKKHDSQSVKKLSLTCPSANLYRQTDFFSPSTKT